LAWESQARQPPVLRRHADAQPYGNGYAGAHLRQGRSRMGPHPPLDDRLGGYVQARLLPARIGRWRDVASGPIVAQPRLDEGATHAEPDGNGALRAAWPLTGTQDLLTQSSESAAIHTRRKGGFLTIK
jgi:hypothetical protein